MLLNSPISVPPDPLSGPRTVGDATDHIRIDPGNARISFAGTARPTCRIPGFRFASTASSAVDGNGSHRWRFDDGTTKSTWFNFGLLPDWVDTAESIILKAAFFVPSSLAAPNDVAQIFSRLSIQRSNAVPTADAGATVDFVFASAGAYAASTVVTITLRTRPGATMQSGDTITGSIQRTGGAAEDTIADALILLATPWIEVTQARVA